MAKEVKEKIIKNALEMFANKGYEGTNIRELSDALGVSKGAMYRHYDSKESLWDAVVEKIEVEYKEKFGSIENLPEIPKSTAELKVLTLNMMNYTMNDPDIVMCRKTLVREQYKDEKMTILSDQHFLTGVQGVFIEIFKGMMEQGTLKKEDYEILALEYTATIGALINQRDRFPKKEKEIIKKGEAYIDHFIKAYGTTNE